LIGVPNVESFDGTMEVCAGVVAGKRGAKIELGVDVKFQRE